MRLIVTRPPAQAASWVQRLQALGVDAQALPLLGIAPPQRPEAVHEAWRGLPGCRLVMFVSPNAVQQFFALRPEGVGWPEATAAGSPGPGTTAALREAGLGAGSIVEPAADSPRFDSEALWLRIQGWPWQGARVLVVRGEDGRDWLADTLRGQGAQVDFVAAYRRMHPQPDAAGSALLAAAGAAPEAHLWHFSSSEAARWLKELAPRADWSRAQALASHPRIAETLRALGFGHVRGVGVAPEDVAAAWREASAAQAAAAAPAAVATPSIQSAAP